jgi:glycosyltransferase involved in cell wall biosynthesis
LVPWKRVDEILVAVAAIEGVGLVIIGDGPERPRLEERVAALGLSGKVYFAGQRDHTEALSLMSQCDLFVLNSTYEGLPHVVLEALMLGLPVVARSVGGVPEVIRDGENGCLIEETSGEDLLPALIKLVSSPADRETLAAGARQGLQRFTFLEMVKTTESLLRSVARDTRSERFPTRSSIDVT